MLAISRRFNLVVERRQLLSAHELGVLMFGRFILLRATMPILE